MPFTQDLRHRSEENAGPSVAMSRPSGQCGPFLLNEGGSIDDYWLDRWECGVALVLAGSIDIKKVWRQVKQQLKEHKIDIYVLHASLWGGGYRKGYCKPKGKFLLLATQTLFSKRFVAVRNHLRRVFDTCEKHEIHWPDASNPDMNFLQKFGLCDALVTLSITEEEQQRRRRLMEKDHRYQAKVIIQDNNPYPDLTPYQRWERAGRLPFFGLPLPTVAPDDDLWDNLFGWEPSPGYLKVSNDKETLSFNALPLNFLLQKAVMERGCSPAQRTALTLTLCAVQTVTSQALAPIFQHKRALKFDPQVIWQATETAVFLGSFLTAGGRWSKEATLVHLTLQHPSTQSIDELQNLQGCQVRSYLESWEWREAGLDWQQKMSLEQRCRRLLEEMMRVMTHAHALLLEDLRSWCSDWGIEGGNVPWGHEPTWDGIGEFIEKALQDAATATERSYWCEPAFQFVFYPRQWTAATPRLWRLEKPDHVVLRSSGAVKKIAKYYLRQDACWEEMGADGEQLLVFPFSSGSPKEDRLVACVLLLDLMLEYDEELDDEDWGKLNVLGLSVKEHCDRVCTFDRHATGAFGGTIAFATPPLQLYRPHAPEAFREKAIYVLKRFTAPDLLVLSSCILGSIPPLALNADPWDPVV